MLRASFISIFRLRSVKYCGDGVDDVLVLVVVFDMLFADLCLGLFSKVRLCSDWLTVDGCVFLLVVVLVVVSLVFGGDSTALGRCFIDSQIPRILSVQFCKFMQFI